ncbi:uncharacterized protein LOC143773839 [Ranitomeya variabilis]|uniref:uncharacterized protein LOC143773839 n=1 Tax=Ranitomeya variabilis TaxID=490064 RepID=UPI004057AACA
MFYFSAACQHGKYNHLLNAIRNLTSTNQTLNCTYVHTVDFTKNCSAVSCSALKSLHFCNSTNKNLLILKKYLTCFKKNVTCDIHEDGQEEDIYSFLKSLYDYFRKLNFSMKR